MRKREEERQLQIQRIRMEVYRGIADIDAVRCTEVYTPWELRQLLGRCREAALTGSQLSLPQIPEALYTRILKDVSAFWENNPNPCVISQMIPLFHKARWAPCKNFFC